MTRLFILLACIVATVSLWANEPGGYTPLVTTPVTSGTVTYRSKTCRYLDNGIIRAIFSPLGNVLSIRYLKPGLSGTPAANGVEMVSQTASSSDGGFGNHTEIYYYWYPDGTAGTAYQSTTGTADRVIENTPERVAFELDYASDLNGKVLRETKRITLIMGQRLFQSDSRFTLDGKPAANLEVAIGLAPQVKESKPAFSPKTGAMMIWEKFDGYGLGTGVVIDPAHVVRMISHPDASGHTQALCLARTDADGGIRWFSGFGWEGQGDISTAEKWTAYLKGFAGKFIRNPYSKDASFKVHTLDVPAAP